MEEKPLAHLRPLKKKTIKRKTKTTFDPIYEKRRKLQEFLGARNSSSEWIRSKFGISPSPETRKLALKDGTFFYRPSDIETMLDHFLECVRTCVQKGD